MVAVLNSEVMRAVLVTQNGGGSVSAAAWRMGRTPEGAASPCWLPCRFC